MTLFIKGNFIVFGRYEVLLVKIINELLRFGLSVRQKWLIFILIVGEPCIDGILLQFWYFLQS